MTSKKLKDDPIALRKQLIQMRLELNQQRIHHESIVLLEPVAKLRGLKQRFNQGATPLLAVAGVTLVSFFMARNRRSASSLMPVVKIAASLLPLFVGKSETNEANKS